tara:strand:- start:267 stop:806 length:540 start_codon:yes stop_codon:yes gene_type:complete
MVWKHKDGRTIQEGTAWDKHPYNWASSWSDADKKRLGLTWEKEVDISFDNRFYWSKGIERKLDDEDAKDKDGKQLYQQDGKTKLINEGLKTIWIRQTKEKANIFLSKWDWQIVRKAEKDKAVDSNVATYRDAVRTACDDIEKKINDCKSLDDFKKLFDMPMKDGVPTGNAPISDFPEEI